MAVFKLVLRRQAQVCARLAEDCDDPRLAERFRLMASDLAAKADALEGFERLSAGKSAARSCA